MIGSGIPPKNILEASHFAAIIGTENAAASPLQCCIDRVNAIKQDIADRAHVFKVALDPATDISVCYVNGSCDICALPDGPGFLRNRFFVLRVERDVSFVIPRKMSPWHVHRQALAKVESEIRDCPVGPIEF